jgi:DNA gyrase subunit A
VRRAGRPETEIADAKSKGDYFLSERQAKAILEMRLSKLTGLEQEKLATEYGELSNEIARLRNILANENVLMDVIVMELEEIKTKFGDKRRTEIVENEAEIADEDLIQQEDMIVTISHAGYIKRTSPSAWRAQKRGGKGKLGMEAREEDWVTQLFVASTHAYIFIFTDRGKVYVKKVFEIPVAARNAKGRAIVNFVGMEQGEKVAAIVEVPKIEEGKYVVTLSKRGQIKKTEVSEYENFRQKGIIGVKIEDGDQLLAAVMTDGARELLIATKQGQSIRFAEEQVRSMGRGTVGVKAIDVGDDDEVVGLAVTDPERLHVLAVCQNGYGKRTLLEEFRQQNRGGKGIILIDTSERNGPVVDIKLVKDGDEVMLITDKGQTLRTTVAEIRETGRNAQGVKIMNVETEEKVVAVERLAESSADGGTGGTEPPPDAEGGGGGGGEGGGGAGGNGGGGDASVTPPPGEGDLN